MAAWWWLGGGRRSRGLFGRSAHRPGGRAALRAARRAPGQLAGWTGDCQTWDDAGFKCLQRSNVVQDLRRPSRGGGTVMTPEPEILLARPNDLHA